jgi:small subunit ribosomal protein S17
MKVKVLNIIDDKTFKAVSAVFKKHKQYGKFVTVYKKYLVDTGGSKVSVGEEVEIENCRPISKRKNWIKKSN